MSYNPFEELISRLERIEVILKGPAVVYGSNIPPVQVPEIIDTETLCMRLNGSQPTVIRMRKRKAIPFLQIGNTIRYNWYEVLKALENKKT